MTIDKHQNRRIRALAERMGTTYSTARKAFLSDEPLERSNRVSPSLG